MFKFLVCSLNILNKSDKHFLHFHDSFHGLAAHIHFDCQLEKYIFIITFTPDKIKGLNKLGNIVADANVSQFSRAGNMYCGNKFCCSETKKVFAME